MTDHNAAGPNAVVHFDIAGSDEHAPHGCYGGLPGWQIQPKGPGYAARWSCPPPTTAGSPRPGWPIRPATSSP